MKLFYLILSILSTWTIFSTSLCKNLRFINFFLIYLKIQNKLLNYLDAQNVTQGKMSTLTSAATKISSVKTATSLLMKKGNDGDEDDNGNIFDVGKLFLKIK
jgi:hypothetical protein